MLIAIKKTKNDNQYTAVYHVINTCTKQGLLTSEPLQGFEFIFKPKPLTSFIECCNQQLTVFIICIIIFTTTILRIIYLHHGIFDSDIRIAGT